MLWFVSLLSSWNSDSDWNLKKYFDNSDKKDTWIKAERSCGSYSTVLDEKWALSTVNSIEAKVKWRDTIRDAIIDDNSDNLDLLYEVKAKLTRPILSDAKLDNKVGYTIYLTFKFIDEDGFIIRNIRYGDFESYYSHEKNNETSLKYDHEDPEIKDITIKVLSTIRIAPNIARLVKRVIYEPEIKAKKHILKEPNDPWDDIGVKWNVIENKNAEAANYFEYAAKFYDEDKGFSHQNTIKE